MRWRLASALFALAIFGGSSFAAAQRTPVPRPRPGAHASTRRAAAPPPSDGILDMSRAIPMKALSTLPSTADQYRSLSGEIAKDKPAVAVAKQQSDALARQAEILQRKLVAAGARIETLEREKIGLDSDIVRLTAENRELSAGFARDRVSVSRLLAILERLQHDMPPAMVLRPDDALAAARGAMLIGASLPDIYGRAAALARRIDALRQTRQALIARRAEAAKNAAYLAQAHIELDQLLAMKRLEADAAESNYSDLKDRLDKVASQAANLQALLKRIAELRAAPISQNVITVTAEKDAPVRTIGRDSLVSPVVGTAVPGGVDGVGGAAAPGLTYITGPGAQVVSPADGIILFAGPYHKSGQVLILQMAGGYDAVLAGLDRLDVRPEDHVLAGEPVGTMSKAGLQPRLYFELRQNGRGMNPAPFLAVALRKAKRS
ncbi:MAG: peptidoglycan DD-metalloendopeptidase family protein [Alphaproteobacteria bacterium]|nr:peptidoglycan DD-metalloendopeptidase family protein [Alphaproteobacteria bacterium]MDE2109506.1 peptidoglycan DD-metalloendopeptidase family protein [Alphaproteobacteria bacterium]MDE2495090.1 peptidoglycan DD-metalloendopeptidase family protein [Alphaproteobacteria bacterium]